MAFIICEVLAFLLLKSFVVVFVLFFFVYEETLGFFFFLDICNLFFIPVNVDFFWPGESFSLKGCSHDNRNAT